MRNLFLVAVALPAAAAPIITITSRVDTQVTDWRGSQSNMNQNQSSAQAFRVDSTSMTSAYSAVATALAGGDPAAETTYVFARSQSNYATDHARAVATTTYRREFEATMDFVARPLNFVPEMQIFTGQFSPVRVLIACQTGTSCSFQPPPATGSGTIEFLQTLNGRFLNSFTIGYDYSSFSIFQHRCEPQPGCQLLDFEAGRQFGGDPAIYAPAQWLTGPPTQVNRGPNVLEYTIRATTEGTFSWYRGIQAQYADPVYFGYRYPDTELFQWEALDASAVPEPATGMLAAVATAVAAAARVLSRRPQAATTSHKTV